MVAFQERGVLLFPALGTRIAVAMVTSCQGNLWTRGWLVLGEGGCGQQGQAGLSSVPEPHWRWASHWWEEVGRHTQQVCSDPTASPSLLGCQGGIPFIF